MHIFDEDIQLTLESPGLYRGKVTDNWSINSVPNGGYIMALAAAAMLKVSEKNQTPIITLNYLSRCMPGDVEITANTISQSKQFDRIEAKLFQEGREKVRATGTFAVTKNGCFIERNESSMPGISPLEKCIPLPVIEKYTLVNNTDVRIDPRCAGWMEGKLADKSEQFGWGKLKNERPFDIASVALIADSFPPAVLATQGLVAWVPTLEFSVNIRKIPETKWLKCIFRTRFINCGLLEEDGEIWDENGELIAISRQIAQFRQAGASA